MATSAAVSPCREELVESRQQDGRSLKAYSNCHSLRTFHRLRVPKVYIRVVGLSGSAKSSFITQVMNALKDGDAPFEIVARAGVRKDRGMTITSKEYTLDARNPFATAWSLIDSPSIPDDASQEFIFNQLQLPKEVTTKLLEYIKTMTELSEVDQERMFNVCNRVHGLLVLVTVQQLGDERSVKVLKDMVALARQEGIWPHVVITRIDEREGCRDTLRRGSADQELVLAACDRLSCDSVGFAYPYTTREIASVSPAKLREEDRDTLAIANLATALQGCNAALAEMERSVSRVDIMHLSGDRINTLVMRLLAETKDRAPHGFNGAQALKLLELTQFDFSKALSAALEQPAA